METSDTLRRMVVRHAGILLIFTVLGAVVSVASVATYEPTYRATARLALGGWDPNDASNAKALADMARAIATSEEAVGKAISSAAVSRDPGAVAGRVSLTAEGNSSIVDVSVSDADPIVAAKLANGIAENVIDIRWNLLRGQVQTLIADVDERSAELRAQRGTLEESISTAQAGSSRRELNVEQYSAVLRQLSNLENERRRLLSLGALQPLATVIDRADVPTSAEDAGGSVAIVLGVVAGLLTGLAIAATLETLRPTVSGPEAVSRALDAPWLGTLPVRPTIDLNGHVEAAADGIRLAAASASAGTLAIVPVGVGKEEAAAVADHLRNGSSGYGSDREIRLGPISEAARVELSRGSTDRGGLVVLAPYTLHRRDLAPIHHVIAATGWPLVGVLLIRKMSGGRRAARARAKHAGSTPSETLAQDRSIGRNGGGRLSAGGAELAFARRTDGTSRDGAPGGQDDLDAGSPSA